MRWCIGYLEIRDGHQAGRGMQMYYNLVRRRVGQLSENISQDISEYLRIYWKIYLITLEGWGS